MWNDEGRSPRVVSRYGRLPGRGPGLGRERGIERAGKLVDVVGLELRELDVEARRVAGAPWNKRNSKRLAHHVLSEAEDVVPELHDAQIRKFLTQPLRHSGVGLRP